MSKRQRKIDDPIIAENASKNYSIHTLTFRARLTKREWNSIKEKLIEFSKKKKAGYYKAELKSKRANKKINYNIASYFGFNMISLLSITIKSSDTYYWMDIKVNPRWMFHRNNHPFVYIADQNELVLCYERIICFLKETKIKEIDENAFYIQRADYCVNIDLEDREHVKEFMRLMRKGAHPYKSKRMMEDCKTGKRKVPTRDSFTVYTDGFEFSVYDKQIQLSGETGKYSEEEIREAEGIIRIELRVKRRKIRYDGKKRGCDDALQFLFHASDIAEDNIPKYLKMAYGSGRFVKLKKAKQIVTASGYKNKTKEKMIKILDRASKNNLQDAKVFYGKDFSKYLKRFNDLNISPITIEKRSRIDEFPGVLQLTEYKNRNYGS